MFWTVLKFAKDRVSDERGHTSNRSNANNLDKEYTAVSVEFFVMLFVCFLKLSLHPIVTPNYILDIVEPVYRMIVDLLWMYVCSVSLTEQDTYGFGRG